MCPVRQCDLRWNRIEASILSMHEKLVRLDFGEVIGSKSEV